MNVIGGHIQADERLIIALDVETVEEARNVVAAIGDTASFYKIGYQLAFAGGIELVRELTGDGKKVFLDMKLLDIDNTIFKAVENIVKLGVTMTTVHAYPKTMKAAVDAARGSQLCVLGVSVLTSMDDQDLEDAGYGQKTSGLVARRAAQAVDAGMGGIVASAHEAAMIRQMVGDNLAVVTPGIRPTGSAEGDQKRTMTPFEAITAGASHLVVGRPIIGAPDMKMAARKIIQEMTS